jgi:pimeloyl-ACP methyl ester carboxylesterase
VLLVRGAHDAIAPRHWLDAMAAALPDAQVVELAHGGHAVHTAARPTARP